MTQTTNTSSEDITTLGTLDLYARVEANDPLALVEWRWRNEKAFHNMTFNHKHCGVCNPELLEHAA